MANAEEQDPMKAINELLEVSPDSSTPSAVSLLSCFFSFFVAFLNDTPDQREKLAILVSTGKSKEVVGVHLTHDQVKRLNEKDVEKYYKRYEAYVSSKTSESPIDSALMLVCKGVGQVVDIDDVKELQRDLKNDYIINNALSSSAGSLALRCENWLAAANAALIITKHIVFNPNKEPDKEPDKKLDKEPDNEPGKEPAEEPGEEPGKELSCSQYSCYHDKTY